MNENINLVEILKDCPRGTKLYSPLAGEVAFCSIEEENGDFPICVKFLHNGDVTVTFWFTEDGRHYNYADGECLLFPSKNQRDWSKFKAPWLKKPKFDPKTLQPFDKVLAKDEGGKWTCGFYSRRGPVLFICIGACWRYCIPYNKDTKHLVGTSEEAPEYYKYWED